MLMRNGMIPIKDSSTNQSRFCAVVSRENGEDPIGTALNFDHSTLSRTGDRQPTLVKQYHVSRLAKAFENPTSMKLINGRNKKRDELHGSES